MRFSLVPRRSGPPFLPPVGRVEHHVEDLLLNELVEAAQDGEEEINRAILSGLIVEEPLRDRSRDGEPVTVLLLSFGAPDERSTRASCRCEIEVPDPVADPHRRRLRPGRQILVLGRLTGAGGIWASSILAWR